MTMDAVLVEVLGHWGMPPIETIERATSGVMNETFIVTTQDAPVVLRRHRRPQRALVQLEHEVIAHARERGVPAPAAIPAMSGDVIIDRDGVFYSLFAFARGQQVTKDEVTEPAARSMGETLGRIQDALADFSGPEPAPTAPPQSSGDLVKAIESLLQRIERIPDPSEQDRWAQEHLESKLRWLEEAAPAVRREVRGAVQMVHGDYQETNLFFEGDRVVDVIDWDKAEVRWPVDEVVRTLDLSLRLEPALSAAFLDGYRSVRNLTREDLDLAANNYGFSQVHDHWLFAGIYVRSDDRLRIFLEPGPFVPFSDRWSQLRADLKDSP